MGRRNRSLPAQIPLPEQTRHWPHRAGRQRDARQHQRHGQPLQYGSIWNWRPRMRLAHRRCGPAPGRRSWRARQRPVRRIRLRVGHDRTFAGGRNRRWHRTVPRKVPGQCLPRQRVRARRASLTDGGSTGRTWVPAIRRRCPDRRMLQLHRPVRRLAQAGPRRRRIRGRRGRGSAAGDRELAQGREFRS